MTEARNNSSRPAEVIPVEVLIEGYAKGIFPMARSRNDPEYHWYTAVRRGVIPIDGFHISRKTRRLIRNTPHRWSVNNDFKAVIEGCADRKSTWISGRIIDSFVQLHEAGYAHSVEVYREGRLVAGLYGVALRSAFFAESIFQYEPEMGKLALFYCHKRLQERGFRLWDTQFYTPHLGQFGCIEIEAKEYDRRLDQALRYPARFDDGPARPS
ncbi:leucyl/phenylalanyl-tRNA--protein transferase [Balneolales bacterium ANBcel1]|nr:leucyl/phenylalanyl-tRNA--protein transferase [Balneolales bacterium ANBcel1]